MHGSELRLFLGQVIPPTPPDIAAVGTILNVFSYDAVSARGSNLSPPRRQADALCVKPQSRFLGQSTSIFI